MNEKQKETKKEKKKNPKVKSGQSKSLFCGNLFPRGFRGLLNKSGNKCVFSLQPMGRVNEKGRKGEREIEGEREKERSGLESD